MPRKKANRHQLDVATKNFNVAYKIVEQHPLFAPLINVAHVVRSEDLRQSYPENGYAVVTEEGSIFVHPKRKADVEQWQYVLAHCLLHLGFEHFQKKEQPALWNIACDLYVAKFLDDFKFGKIPGNVAYVLNDLPASTEEKLYQYLIVNGVEERFQQFSTGNPGMTDMDFTGVGYSFSRRGLNWKTLLSTGLRAAVTSAVNVAGGQEKYLGAAKLANSPAQRAKSWFISSYPLLGALAASFELIEDPQLCQQLDISVAAVHPEMKEIYLNPASGLTEMECRFVIAHELLHIGLRHDTRCNGRNPFYWNVACDYVINGWLVEMGIGEIPAIGGLYDSALKAESAESVYDIIVTDLRRLRKLSTWRGVGQCDILQPRQPDWWRQGNGLDLDSFYRNCLMQGLEYHQSEVRGLLPAGLVEEIKALGHPPIPWDVELAQWFDGHFQPLEKVRTYARPSRRQSGSPDIPRPRYAPLWEAEQNRTFGVVLDTSGSMDRTLLARALGAISTYSISRDVSKVRLIFCDAITYDEGFVTPEELSGRVKIRGRGGTVLQPGIDLLQNADDFPKKGPILIITDGFCERLSLQREHAFLLPAYGRLPFVPKGKVFRIQ